jgi:hypothetical protein
MHDNSSKSLEWVGSVDPASATVHDHIVVGPDRIGEPAGARGQGRLAIRRARVWIRREATARFATSLLEQLTDITDSISVQSAAGRGSHPRCACTRSPASVLILPPATTCSIRARSVKPRLPLSPILAPMAGRARRLQRLSATCVNYRRPDCRCKRPH